MGNTMPPNHYANTMPLEHYPAIPLGLYAPRTLCPQNTMAPEHYGPRTLCPWNTMPRHSVLGA